MSLIQILGWSLGQDGNPVPKVVEPFRLFNTWLILNAARSVSLTINPYIGLNDNDSEWALSIVTCKA